MELINFHEDILQVISDDSGKESRYKRRIISYLLSHATAWPRLSLRLALIACTSMVQDISKLSLLAPLIEELSKSEIGTLLAGWDGAQQQAYVNGILSAFNDMDPSAASPVFPALLELVRKALSDPDKESNLRGVFGTIKVVTATIQINQRLEICHLLLSLTEHVDQVCGFHVG